MKTHSQTGGSHPLPDPDPTSPNGALLHRILVPTDLSAPSHKALDYARVLAAQAHASIHLLYVVEPTPFLSSLNDLPIMLSEEDVTAQWKRSLARLAEEHSTAEMSVTSEVRNGKAADEIVRLAEESKADMVVISTHGSTGLKHVLLGSTAEKVVRHSAAPVMVVREKAASLSENENAVPQRFGKIVVPTDFSARSEEVLRYASRFAALFGSELIVLHCVHYEPSIVGPEFGAFDLAALQDVSRKNAAGEIANLIKACLPPEVPARAEVRTGPPIGEIPDCARELDADLIICATHGRTGLPHVVFGSTAEGIVRHAPCPVLVLPQRSL